MSGIIAGLRALVAGESQADRVVPPSGHTARLTAFTAGAMAFLTVFSLALSLAAGRLADRWQATLTGSATIRISAPGDQMVAQTNAVLAALKTTPGVSAFRALSVDEERALLTPWFGPDLPLDALPIPQLIEVEGQGYDTEGLRQRLAAEAPGAVFDDHTRWREPLVRAAMRIRALGLVAIALIAGATAAMITLAASAALSANAQVIRVLRLVGARDVYIARAFVRRFSLRALVGAMVGTGAGVAAVAFLPAADEAGGFLTGLGFQGIHWLWPLAIPPLAAVVAFVATRAAALRVLRGLM